MNGFIQFLQDHGPIIAAWVTRELHIWGPKIKPAYFWIKSQGGVVKILLNILWCDPRVPTYGAPILIPQLATLQTPPVQQTQPTTETTQHEN